MSREKQIEEMIKEIEKCSCVYTPCDRECGQCSNAEMYEDTINHIARTIYEAGYRKQSEGKWVFNKEKDEFFCSVCNAEPLIDPHFIGIDYGIEILSDFCPWCGAKMSKGDSNEN